MRLIALLDRIRLSLVAASIPDAHVNARHIVAAAIGARNGAALNGVLTQGRASDAQVARAEQFAHRRVQREPLQFIVGNWDFDVLCDLAVKPPVLIPRQETEFLVELASEHIRRVYARLRRPVRVLDVGCGSGAIGLALATRFSADVVPSVVAVDTSIDAVELTRANASNLSLVARMDVLHSDFKELAPAQPFDLVVSNPPYIPRCDVAGLEAEVREWEDHAALDGGPNEGIDVIIALMHACSRGRWLSTGGALLLETHSSHPAMLAALLRDDIGANTAAGMQLRYDPRALVASFLPWRRGERFDSTSSSGGHIPLWATAELVSASSLSLTTGEGSTFGTCDEPPPRHTMRWQPESPHIVSRMATALENVVESEVRGSYIIGCSAAAATASTGVSATCAAAAHCPLLWRDWRLVDAFADFGELPRYVHLERRLV